MKVLKRNGKEVQFDVQKIINAVNKANKEAPPNEQMIPEQIQVIGALATAEIEKLGHTPTIENIQDIVIAQIMKQQAYTVARLYTEYRFRRELARKKNTTDDAILSLIDYENEEVKQENSNKNPMIASTQRDYIAGEVSKDLTMRVLLPSDVVAAHKSGAAHFHDADYFVQRIHNCFTGGTRFITDKGVRQFRDFKDGDTVFVKDKDGIIRKATVHCYGEKSMQKVKFKNPRMTQEVICTPDHRWILSDGTVTTSLKKNDKLYGVQDSTNIEINNNEDAFAFAVGFIIGDGTDHFDRNNHGSSHVRLCGEKNKYKDIFIQAGFSEQHIKNSTDTVMYYSTDLKQNFLNGKAWRYMTAEHKALVFKGLYAADGSTKCNKLCTNDSRIELMIEELSGIAGYYISSKKITIHDTAFKKNAELTEYHFITKTPTNWAWTVESIKPYHGSEKVKAWCIEEPITHSFMLEKGIVTGNCDLINLEDMLQNGTVITETQITKPKSLATAANVATQIIAQVASSQYGGQTFTLSHLAPFVNISRQKIIRKLKQDFEKANIKATTEQIQSIAENRLHDEIKAAIQTIQYQLVTLMTTNGQTPFVSMFMYLDEVPEGQTRNDLALLIEEVLKQRIEGLPNEKGELITPAFPKLLYTLDEDNIHKDSKYYYLTELAAKCIAKRMVPDCISAKIMKELKGEVYPCMGCRSFLTPDRFTDKNIGNIANAKNYDPNKHKYYGRFNQGVFTINLPYIACLSNKNMDKFWEELDKMLNIAHKALRCRHERLLGTTADMAPILWRHGALARLEKGETIDKLLYNGYSTISLGYAGLYECCMYMTGKSHTDENAKNFAIAVMQKLNDACAEWKAAENIDYSLYGTPLESSTYKFAKAIQDKFGKIKNVSDHNYITNSYHVNVRENIGAFDKLKFEAEFQKLSPGGAISYVELPNMENNTDAIISIMQYMYENIMYAEMNIKSDYCQVCGYDGEIKIIEDNDGKLIWECPNCGNRDQHKMNVARRTCGYIGTQFWNQGRTEEIKDRVLHVSNETETI